MGQQQLILIAVGVIIVGVAVTVGLTYFPNKAVQFNRDAIIKDLVTLASDAQAYYKKASGSGGGQGSFVGYNIPQKLKLTDNGSFRIVNTRQDRIILQGVGKETREQDLSCNIGGLKITYRITVTPEGTNLHQIY